MNYLFDKCVLFLFCLMMFPFNQIMPLCVFACLLAVAVSAGLCVFPRKAVCVVFPLYTMLLFFFPQPAMFLPLLAYDVFPETKDDSPAAPENRFPFRPADRVALLSVAGALVLFFFFRGSLGFRHAFLPYRFQLLILLSGCILALLLRCRTGAQLRLHRQLLRTRDDDMEFQLLLEERNRSLMEKQDSEIYTATLRERNRIAREIHDNVGHLLTRAILMTGALKATCRDPSSEEPLRQLGDTLDHAMDSIRSSVHDLHDSSVNLEDSLRAMIQSFSFCPVSLQYRMSPDLPREIRYSLIAIAKEALVNISRHSNATSASITAIEHPGFYQFIIQDNGDTADGFADGDPHIGIDPAGRGGHTPDFRSSDPAGIGLENIRARVSALHGNLQIRTTDGFRIYITIPRA